MMDEYHVTLYALRAPMKAALAEYGVKKVKEKIYKHITHQRDRGINPAIRYADHLVEMVQGINSSINRKTGFAPNDVTFDNQHILIERTYGDKI